MTKKELDSLCELLSHKSSVMLGFEIARGQGYSDYQIINLLWDHCNHTTYQIPTQAGLTTVPYKLLELGDYSLIKNTHTTEWKIGYPTIYSFGKYINCIDYDLKLNAVTALFAKMIYDAKHE